MICHCITSSIHGLPETKFYIHLYITKSLTQNDENPIITQRALMIPVALIS